MMFTYSEIQMAFEFVSSGEEGDNFAYLCKDAGEIFYYSEMLGLDERRGRDMNSGNCFLIPHRNSLDLGRELAFDFIDEVLPSEYAAVRDAFADPEDAQGQYIALLETNGKLQEWYDYQSHHTSRMLREWCAARGIAVEV